MVKRSLPQHTSDHSHYAHWRWKSCIWELHSLCMPVHATKAKTQHNTSTCFVDTAGKRTLRLAYIVNQTHVKLDNLY